MTVRDFLRELKRRNVFKVAAVYAITGWLVIQVATSTFPVLMLPVWLTRAVVILTLLGFPITMIIAWAFELTPEGVKRTNEVTEEKSVTKKTGQKINNILVALLVLAVGYIFYQQFFKTRPSVTGTVSKGNVMADSAAIPAKSIAVLPFENLSTDTSNAYFADGMQDMILTKLADIGDLKVISQTSTERYKSHPGDLKTIASQLGVATILEGSVQKTGNQVLINVQLIEARTDNHIWANAYQRTLKNMFGVEGEVAQKIASALNAKLSPTESKDLASVPTHNPAAYDAYLRGLSVETNTSDISTITLEKVASHYEQAVKLDPGFALAWAHLSSVNSNISFSEFSPERLARAKSALDQAIKLASDAAATQIAKGNYAYYGHLDYHKALVAYRKALQIAPNSAVALLNIGFVERREGHWKTAIDYMDRSLAFDPRNVITLSNLALSYWALHREAKAKVLLRRALAISPGNPIVVSFLAKVYQNQGDLAQAGTVLADAKISPNDWLLSYPTVIKHALLTRHYDVASHLAQKALAIPHLPKPAEGIYYRLLGFAEQLAGHRKAARNAYRKAVTTLKSVLPSKSEQTLMFASVIIILARAQAGLGEKDEALASARRAITLLPTSRDAFIGPRIELGLAMVQSQVGERAQAITTLGHLLDTPPGNWASGVLTPVLIRLNPIWDPLRSDPAFKALLKKYSSKKQEAGS